MAIQQKKKMNLVKVKFDSKNLCSSQTELVDHWQNTENMESF